MKKMTYFVMAMALVLGLSQCKKNVDEISNVPSVFITLDVDGGSKVDVEPEGAPTFATVTF